MTRQEKLQLFWSKVDRGLNNECWDWLASKDEAGYGTFRGAGLSKSNKSHRIMFEIFNGEITNGLLVCHSCDYPPCVNPNHLFLGTQQENATDKVSKNRQTKGSDCHKAKLDNDVVRRFFELNQQGYNQTEIQNITGVSRKLVSSVLRGVDWKHVKTPYRDCVKDNWNLPDETIVEIFKQYKLLGSTRKVSEKLGIGSGTVYEVLARLTYQNVEIPPEHEVTMQRHCKVSDAGIVEMFRLRHGGMKVQEIAWHFGITYNHTAMILRRERSGHVPIPQEYIWEPRRRCKVVEQAEQDLAVA